MRFRKRLGLCSSDPKTTALAGSLLHHSRPSSPWKRTSILPQPCKLSQAVVSSTAVAELADSCLGTGEFHANAAAPPAPLAPLTVDLCGRSIRCHLEPEELSQVDLVCHANLPPSSHPSYSRTVTFSNLQKCPQSFTMAIESDRAEDAAAFRLVSAVPSVPQDPDVFRGCMCLPESRSEQGAKVFEPGTLFLPPRESVDVTVQFVPSKQRLQGRQDYSVAAALVLRYNNCDVQHLPVQASVLHPELKASVEVLDFGQAHPQAPKYLEIEISNHSQADAEWKIAAPGANDSGTGGKKPAALLIRDSSGLASTAEPTPSLAAAKTRPAAVPQKEGTAEEDPFEATSAARLVAAAPDLAQAVGCFVVSPRQGLLHSMGNTLPATQRIRITFCPPANAAYRRELVFSAKRGRSCKVVLTGRGSYDETVEFKANLMSL